MHYAKKISIWSKMSFSYQEAPYRALGQLQASNEPFFLFLHFNKKIGYQNNDHENNNRFGGNFH
jgi:hypothetical protein